MQREPWLRQPNSKMTRWATYAKSSTQMQPSFRCACRLSKCGIFRQRRKRLCANFRRLKRLALSGLQTAIFASWPQRGRGLQGKGPPVSSNGRRTYSIQDIEALRQDLDASGKGVETLPASPPRWRTVASHLGHELQGRQRQDNNGRAPCSISGAPRLSGPRHRS